MSGLTYGDLVFDPDFLFADRGASERLKFTRHERALLKLFIENPNRLLSRTKILDAITHEGSDLSDRNVDFLVNRLRTKLGDSARAPRYIATQYGEGYVWIAERHEGIDAFVVIGPCHGMGDAETARRAEPVLAEITQTLARAMENKHAVVLKPDWSADAALGETSYSVDASLHADGDLLHGAFVLRDGGTGRILQAFRAVFRLAHADCVRELAAHIKDAIWAHRALPLAPHVAATDTPLELRMHDAALLLSRTPESWQKAQEQIERARSNNPDDPMLAIMQGFSLYVALLQRLHSPDEWRAAETEIETLVFNSLPAIQDNPLLVLGAAKLLFFIGRGHFDLANRLADEAFEKSTAFAAAFSTRAQMRMAEGAFAKAHLLYDKAIELSEPGSEFFIYLKILKSTAALADNDRATVDAIAAELYALNPLIEMKIGLFLTSPDVDLSPNLVAVLSTHDKPKASWLVTYLYNVSARRFHAAEHRRNIMRGLITHLSRRFGEDVVPAEVRNGIGG